MSAYLIFTHYIPTLVKAAILYCLQLLPAASALDFRTTLFLALVRASTSSPKPGKLIDSQQSSLRDTEKEESIYLLQTELSLPPDTNIVDVVSSAIKNLGDGQESFSKPRLHFVSLEWIGHRNTFDEAVSNTDLPELRYSAMMRDVRNKTVILYFHGGQFWRMGRAPKRITHELARESGGRCLAVQYRLSPQNPFPAAVIEGLAAYLCLLYPPADSLHTPVTAHDICFAGDSAGGNLVISLIQLILEINRESRNNASLRLIWDGEERDVPVPAGASVLSPYNDLTRALDNASNLQYDIIPARGPPFAAWDRCEVWPASPPRHHVYANDNALLNPLVSPVTAEDWSGSPPTWICVGEECLADQGMFVAQQMASQNVPVVLEQYSAMPHNFSLLVPDIESSKTSKARWTSFIHSVVNDPGSIKTKAIRWSGHPLRGAELDISNLVSGSLETLKARMRNQIREWGPAPL